jgi:hypothetical protein
MSRNGHLAQLEREDARLLSERRLAVTVRQMRDLGFSEREAPFAASARLTRGKCSVSVMREHLRTTLPWLYEDDQGAAQQ